MFLPPDELLDVKQIPIFVWDRILLPFDSTQKSVHITEPKYVELLSDIEFGDRIFGIVPRFMRNRETKLPHINATGCFAKLTELDKFDSGDANAKMQGLARFRIVEHLNTEKPYPVAAIKFFEEEDRSLRGTLIEDEALNRELTREACLVGQRIVTKIMRILSKKNDYEFPLMKPEPLFFSFMMAPLFSFDFDDYSKLLQAMSIEIRLRYGIERLKEMETQVDDNASRHKFIDPFLKLANNKNNPNLS